MNKLQRKPLQGPAASKGLFVAVVMIVFLGVAFFGLAAHNTAVGDMAGRPVRLRSNQFPRGTNEFSGRLW